MPEKSKKYLSFNNRIFIATIALVLISTASMSYVALKGFEKAIVPEMDKKAVVISDSIKSLVGKIVGYGVPFTSLTGMEVYLSSVIKDNPEITYIIITDMQKHRLYQAGHVPRDTRSAPQSQDKTAKTVKTSGDASDYFTQTSNIVLDGNTMGSLTVAIDKKYVRTKMLDIIYDIITVIVVTLLISFEMVIFLVNYGVTAPINALHALLVRSKRGNFSYLTETKSNDEIGDFMETFNDVITSINRSFNELGDRIARMKKGARTKIAEIKKRYEKLRSTYTFGPDNRQETAFNSLIYIRPPLFLLIFADSLSLSFFPFYVRELYTPVPGISENVVIGLPISIFMLFWAFSLPYAGAWSDKIGRRKPLILGAILTSAGLILTGLAQTMYDLLLWRSITAIGYGTVYITCQGYITDNTTSKNRTKGMAMFLAGFFSGSLCGSAIGGILVDRIGFRTTFFISAVVSLLSALFVANYLMEQRKEASAQKKKMRIQDFKLLMGNKKFLSITLFSSIPAKICLTGFLYYAAPMFLKQLGNTQSSIGRVLMSYGIMMIFVSPLVGTVADRWHFRRAFTNIGGIMSGIGLLLLLFWQTTAGVLFSIGILGVAHSIQVSSQMALITDDCVEEGGRIGMATVVGIYRLIERLGNISGPIVAGVLIAIFGTSYGETKSFPYAIAFIGILTILSSFIFMISYSILDHREKVK